VVDVEPNLPYCLGPPLSATQLELRKQTLPAARACSSASTWLRHRCLLPGAVSAVRWKRPPPAIRPFRRIPGPPGSPRLLWGTRRRFDPSSSPSATRSSVQASASTNRLKIPEQKWGFRGSWLYLRLPICGTVSLEKAFFSKASYFVGSVRFRKVKRQRHNLESKSASVRVSVG
jgi:hypothetical protein